MGTWLREAQPAPPLLYFPKRQGPCRGLRPDLVPDPEWFWGSPMHRPRSQTLTRHRACEPRPQVSQPDSCRGRVFQLGVKVFFLEADAQGLHLFIYLFIRRCSVSGRGCCVFLWREIGLGKRAVHRGRGRLPTRCPSAAWAQRRSGRAVLAPSWLPQT